MTTARGAYSKRKTRRKLSPIKARIRLEPLPVKFLRKKKRKYKKYKRKLHSLLI